MAKKTVASLQTSSKRLSKAIKMVKSQKLALIHCENYGTELVDEFLKRINYSII
jgi:dihydroxyacetone kinase